MSPDASDVEIRSMPDIDRAAHAYRHTVERTGDFRIILCADIASSRPMTNAEGAILASRIFGFVSIDDRWWDQPQKALASPLSKACRYESTPFWVNAGGFRTQHDNPALAAISLRDFERRSRVGAAIVIPVYLPFGQIAMAALGTRMHDQVDLSRAYARHADELSVLTRRFLSSYVQITRRPQWIPSDCGLSRRQIQCLRLVSAGLTGAEMARIVGCSHSTVRYHLREASERLQAVSLTQAVFKAGQLGYLNAQQAANITDAMLAADAATGLGDPAPAALSLR